MALYRFLRQSLDTAFSSVIYHSQCRSISCLGRSPLGYKTPTESEKTVWSFQNKIEALQPLSQKRREEPGINQQAVLSLLAIG